MVSLGDEAGALGVLENKRVSHRARLVFHASHEDGNDVLQMGVEVVDRLVIDAPGHHRKSRQGRVAFDYRLVGQRAVGIALVLLQRGAHAEVLVLKRVRQLVPEDTRRFELQHAGDGVAILRRQLDRQRPIDDDDVAVVVVVEAGNLERHVGEVFAAEFQIGRQETDQLVLLDADLDFLLAYLALELSGEPSLGRFDAKIGDRNIGGELEPANLLDSRFHHARLVAAQGAIYLGSRDVAEQCADDACGCDYRDEPKTDSPQDALSPFSHPCLTGIPIGGNHAAAHDWTCFGTALYLTPKPRKASARSLFTRASPAAFGGMRHNRPTSTRKSSGLFPRRISPEPSQALINSRTAPSIGR